MAQLTKKILVTGGCGFVGRHLIGALSKEKNNEIWVVDDLSTGRHPATWENPTAQISRRQPYRSAVVFELNAKLNTANHLVFVNADFASLASSELGRQPNLGYPKLPRFDEVYHLASVVGGRMMIDGDPLNVAIDLAIDSSFYLWAAKINRPKRILYASSSAAYPVSKQRANRSVALRESMIDFNEGFQQPDFTYGWSKLSGEFLSRVAVQKYGLRVAIVRPFSGYGEDQDLTYPVPAIALRVANHDKPVRVWGTGLQGRDFVHIDDCVDACILACRKIEDGSAVNIGSGHLVSFKDLAKLMIKLEGYNADVKGTTNKPTGVAQRYCDPARMKQILDWYPSIGIEEGMRRVLAGAHKRLMDGIKPKAI